MATELTDDTTDPNAPQGTGMNDVTKQAGNEADSFTPVVPLAPLAGVTVLSADPASPPNPPVPVLAAAGANNPQTVQPGSGLSTTAMRDWARSGKKRIFRLSELHLSVARQNNPDLANHLGLGNRVEMNPAGNLETASGKQYVFVAPEEADRALQLLDTAMGARGKAFVKYTLHSVAIDGRQVIAIEASESVTEGDVTYMHDMGVTVGVSKTGSSTPTQDAGEFAASDAYVRVRTAHQAEPMGQYGAPHPVAPKTIDATKLDFSKGAKVAASDTQPVLATTDPETGQVRVVKGLTSEQITRLQQIAEARKLPAKMTAAQLDELLQAGAEAGITGASVEVLTGDQFQARYHAELRAGRGTGLQVVSAKGDLAQAHFVQGTEVELPDRIVKLPEGSGYVVKDAAGHYQVLSVKEFEAQYRGADDAAREAISGHAKLLAQQGVRDVADYPWKMEHITEGPLSPQPSRTVASLEIYDVDEGGVHTPADAQPIIDKLKAQGMKEGVDYRVEKIKGERTGVRIVVPDASHIVAKRSADLHGARVTEVTPEATRGKGILVETADADAALVMLDEHYKAAGKTVTYRRTTIGNYTMITTADGTPLGADELRLLNGRGIAYMHGEADEFTGLHDEELRGRMRGAKTYQDIMRHGGFAGKDHITLKSPQGETARAGAAEACELAERTKLPIVWQHDGVQMTIHPGDDVDTILHERMLHRIASSKEVREALGNGEDVHLNTKGGTEAEADTLVAQLNDADIKSKKYWDGEKFAVRITDEKALARLANDNGATRAITELHPDTRVTGVPGEGEVGAVRGGRIVKTVGGGAIAGAATIAGGSTLLALNDAWNDRQDALEDGKSEEEANKIFIKSFQRHGRRDFLGALGGDDFKASWNAFAKAHAGEGFEKLGSGLSQLAADFFWPAIPFKMAYDESCRLRNEEANINAVSKISPKAVQHLLDAVAHGEYNGSDPNLVMLRNLHAAELRYGSDQAYVNAAMAQVPSTAPAGKAAKIADLQQYYARAYLEFGADRNAIRDHQEAAYRAGYAEKVDGVTDNATLVAHDDGLLKQLLGQLNADPKWKALLASNQKAGVTLDDLHVAFKKSGVDETKLDRDGNGQIDLKEVTDALVTHGIGSPYQSDREAYFSAQRIGGMLTDEGGLFDHHKSVLQLLNEESGVKAIDADHHRGITEVELISFLKEKNIRLDELDANHDGQITISELNAKLKLAGIDAKPPVGGFKR